MRKTTTIGMIRHLFKLQAEFVVVALEAEDEDDSVIFPTVTEKEEVRQQVFVMVRFKFTSRLKPHTHTHTHTHTRHNPAFVVAATLLLHWRARLFLLKLSKRTVTSHRLHRHTQVLPRGSVILPILVCAAAAAVAAWISITGRWYLQTGLLSLEEQGFRVKTIIRKP
jgi:hypothetical protein